MTVSISVAELILEELEQTVKSTIKIYMNAIEDVKSR